MSCHVRARHSLISKEEFSSLIIQYFQFVSCRPLGRGADNWLSLRPLMISDRCIPLSKLYAFVTWILISVVLYMSSIQQTVTVLIYLGCRCDSSSGGANNRFDANIHCTRQQTKSGTETRRAHLSNCTRVWRCLGQLPVLWRHPFHDGRVVYQCGEAGPRRSATCSHVVHVPKYESFADELRVPGGQRHVCGDVHNSVGHASVPIEFRKFGLIVPERGWKMQSDSGPWWATEARHRTVHVLFDLSNKLEIGPCAWLAWENTYILLFILTG